MKKTVFILSLLLLFINCKKVDPKKEIKTNNEVTMKAETIYQFKVTDLYGEEFDFSTLKGKRIMVVNTASECGLTPQYEILQELYETYKNDNVTVLGVNYDRVDDQQLQQIIIEMGVAFPTLTSDPAEQLGIGAIPGLPATYIFNPQGKLTAKLYGAQTQETLLSAIVLAKS